MRGPAACGLELPSHIISPARWALSEAGVVGRPCEQGDGVRIQSRCPSGQGLSHTEAGLPYFAKGDAVMVHSGEPHAYHPLPSLTDSVQGRALPLPSTWATVGKLLHAWRSQL